MIYCEVCSELIMQKIACPTCLNPLVYSRPLPDNPRKVENVNIYELVYDMKLDERFQTRQGDSSSESDKDDVIDTDTLILDFMNAYLKKKGICELGMCCRNTILTDDREALYDVSTYMKLAPPPSVENQKYGLEESEFG